jgi:hypothetical protein
VLGTELVAAAEQAGEEVVRSKGIVGGAFSAARAGTTAERAKRPRSVMNFFISI